MEKSKLSPQLQGYCEALTKEFAQIPEERKAQLQELSNYMLKKLKNKEKCRITVICTHNSRRSQMGQLWFAAGAVYFEIPDIESFSGGTEATAFHPNAIRALQKAGFGFEQLSEGSNPHYQAVLGQGLEVKELFSKKYSDELNPKKEFCALMVCSQADEACPVVFGAEKRISLPFEDPKAFDGKAQEAEAYDQCCRLIGRELMYALYQVRENL